MVALDDQPANLVLVGAHPLVAALGRETSFSYTTPRCPLANVRPGTCLADRQAWRGRWRVLMGMSRRLPGLHPAGACPCG